MSNKLDGFLTEIGYSIVGGSTILSGTGFPGGDAAQQDNAPIGSIFLRKDTGNIYSKLTSTNSPGDWSIVVNMTSITNSTITPSFLSSIVLLEATLTTGLEIVVSTTFSQIDTNAGTSISADPAAILFNNNSAGETDWGLGFGARAWHPNNVTIAGNTFNPYVQLVSLEKFRNASLGLFNYAAASGNTSAQGMASLVFGRSNATSVTGVGALAANDILAQISFVGDDGSVLLEGARIQARAAGTWSGSSLPSTLEFYSTAASSTTPVLGMKLNQNQNLIVTNTIFGASPNGTASGTNTYTVTITDFTAYQIGQIYTILFPNANTGAATLNINSVGAITIQLRGSDLIANQIPPNSTLELMYDGTNFQLVGPSGGNSNGVWWLYKAKASVTSGDPSSGKIIWDNSSQPSAAHINFSHLTSDNLDIDLLLSELASGMSFTLQDSDNSQNYQRWLVNGTPSNINAGLSNSYWIVPVAPISSGGTGAVNFPNNTQVVAFVNFSNNATNTAIAYYGTASGTNTYTATLTPAPTAYTSGTVYTVLFTNANTGASTINLNGLGAITIQLNNTALSAGAIAANSTLDLIFDGTNLQIIGPSGGSSGVNYFMAIAFGAWS